MIILGGRAAIQWTVGIIICGSLEKKFQRLLSQKPFCILTLPELGRQLLRGSQSADFISHRQNGHTPLTTTNYTEYGEVTMHTRQ